MEVKEKIPRVDRERIYTNQRYEIKVTVT